MTSETRLRSGMLIFPNLTQLDLTGPYEVLARLPEAETLSLWKTLDPVRSEHGLTILPMATLAWPEPRPDPRSGRGWDQPLARGSRRSPFCVVAAAARVPSSASAPTRWCSVLQDCCAAGAPDALDVARACCANSGPSRSRSGRRRRTCSPAAAPPRGNDVALTVAAEIAGKRRRGDSSSAIEYVRRRPSPRLA